MKIDGRHISQLGATLERGGFASFLAYPSMREPDSQEWAEYDGVEVDLSNPKLSERTVTLNFACNDVESMDNLIYVLSSPGYRIIQIFGVNRRLRYISQSDITPYINGYRFSVTLSDDFPRHMFSRSIYTPTSFGLPLPPMNRYYLDDRDFKDYGLIVLSGKTSVYHAPDIKEALKVTNSVMDGVVYDTVSPKFKAKEETLKVAFYADSVERLLNNYEAFFYDLIKPNERILTTSYLLEGLKFYYSSAENFEFTLTTNYALLEFDLTLTFTDYRPSELEVLLATEDWILITTENGLDFIDMEYYGS